MPQLSVIVPTFNELGNVVELRNRVAEALTGIDWEMIFVDDNSPDGTAQAVREMAQADRRVRCIQRIGRRGLSTACIEGMLASSAPIVAVIDADLQHDERLLPKMFELIQGGDLDVVVGSRYVESGGIGNWDSSRAAFSRWATQLSRVVLKADLKDPMSGFFMIRHEAAPGLHQGRHVRRRLQDPAGSVRHVAHAAAPPRAALRVPQPRRRRKQAGYQRGLGILHHAAGQVHRRCGAHPLHRVLIGRRPGPGGAPDRAGRNVQGPGHVLFCGPRAAPRWWP
jgi:hypothetical protein